MVEENKEKSFSGKEEKKKLEKDLLDLLSSASEDIETEKERGGQEETGAGKEGLKERAARPEHELAKKIYELFPEISPTVDEGGKKSSSLIEVPGALTDSSRASKVKAKGEAEEPGRAGPGGERKEKEGEAGSAGAGVLESPKTRSPEPGIRISELPSSRDAGKETGKQAPVSTPAEGDGAAKILTEDIGEKESLPSKREALSSAGFLSKILRPLQKNILCLALEGRYVRVLSLQGRTVVRWATIPQNPRYIRNGLIINPQSWGEQLHSSLEREGFQAASLYSALSVIAVTREFKLPQLSGDKLKEVVEREARRLLSYSGEKDTLSWQKLDSKGLFQKVFVMVVPKEPLATFTDALTYAGLKPKYIELKSMALRRAIGVDHAIIAHGELNNLEISVVVSGIPRVLRSLYLGDELLPKEEATARLIDELGKTLTFHNDMYREEPLDISVPVFLTGELAMESSLSLRVKALTGREIMPPNVDLIYPPNFPLPSYLVNAGLALKSLS